MFGLHHRRIEHANGQDDDANDDGRRSDEVRALLSTTSTDLGPSGRDSLYGYGLVNAPAALAALPAIMNATSTPPQTRVASVSSIAYARAGARNLNINVTIVDGAQAPIAGASVSVSVASDNGSVASGTGTTNSNGTATFQLKNAGTTCYHTDVTAVSAPNVSFDGAEPPNSSCQ